MRVCARARSHSRTCWMYPTTSTSSPSGRSEDKANRSISYLTGALVKAAYNDASMDDAERQAVAAVVHHTLHDEKLAKFGVASQLAPPPPPAAQQEWLHANK